MPGTHKTIQRTRQRRAPLMVDVSSCNRRSTQAMPIFLRKDTIRLFEASLESLSLAILSLGLPDTKYRRVEATHYAASIGLIGSSAELAVSACYVQARGPKILLTNDGMYKSAKQILSEFIALLKSPTPQLSFISNGVDKPDEHRKILLDKLKNLRLLATARAGGLHAGRGPNRATCVLLARNLVLFLEHLSKSAKIHPYLETIPKPHDEIVEYTAIINDLQKKLLSASTDTEKSEILANIYLVLPNMPDEKPEWIDVLERVSIAPKPSDINLLLTSLETAVPITFRKTVQGEKPISAIINPSDPNAIPIAPHYLKSEFTQITDKFFADIANANGRLSEKIIDPPPHQFVNEIFANGLEELGIIEEGQSLTAHQAWPFIVSGLIRQGTIGPIWFFVRKTTDLSQLQAILKKVAKLGNKRFKNNIQFCVGGIEAVKNKVPAEQNELFRKTIEYGNKVEIKKNNLKNFIDKSSSIDKVLPDVMSQKLLILEENEEPLGPFIEEIIQSDIDENSKGYWVKTLTEMCEKEEDLYALVEILKEPDRVGAHTASRKAINLIDFQFYGPEVMLTSAFTATAKSRRA